MAARKSAANPKKTSRKGWTKREDSPPEPLDMAVGDEVVGTLGPVKQSKQFDRSYRILTTEDGRYYLNESAALVQAGVFEMPTGQRVLIVRTKDVPIKGQANPMKGFDVYTPEGNEDNSDLPF